MAMDWLTEFIVTYHTELSVKVLELVHIYLCVCAYVQSISHVRRAVVWLVHAVSSQQVSEEGFVSNGGVWVATWGGRGGEVYIQLSGNQVCQACLCDNEPLVLCTHAHLLTQGSYFPQNNTKRPPAWGEQLSKTHLHMKENMLSYKNVSWLTQRAQTANEYVLQVKDDIPVKMTMQPLWHTFKVNPSIKICLFLWDFHIIHILTGKWFHWHT